MAMSAICARPITASLTPPVTWWPKPSRTGSAEIDAATLAERLPAALKIAEQREREIYEVTDPADIEPCCRAIATLLRCAPQAARDRPSLPDRRQLLAALTRRFGVG